MLHIYDATLGEELGCWSFSRIIIPGSTRTWSIVFAFFFLFFMGDTPQAGLTNGRDTIRRYNSGSIDSER